MKKQLLPSLLILMGAYSPIIHSQISMQPDSESPDLVKVYVKQDPTTYKKTSTQNGIIDFAVQVSASSKPFNENSVKKEWNDLGHVYIQQENGMYKIRIGPFDTQMEAKQILLQAKSKGKKDAFIVVLQGTTNDKPMFQSGTEKKSETKPKNEKKVVTQPELDPNSQIAAETPTAEYKVRLASYLKPGSFNTNGLDKIGKLESYRKGDLTIMMIGGFHSLKDAQNARMEAMAKGYNDATIVVDNQGVLEEVVTK